MKKIIKSLVVIFSFFTFHNCSVDDYDIEYSNELSDQHYIENAVLGKWKYWGRFSVERNQWIYNGSVDASFQFNNDNSFEYENKTSNEKISGKYKIIPKSKYNPYILLEYENTSKQLLLISLDKTTMSVFDSPNEEKYKKNN